MRKLKESHISGEKLFKYYFSMGEAASIAKLARWAVSEGVAKPVSKGNFNKNGLPFMSCWKAMWRWASQQENKTDAYYIFKEYVKKYGWTIDTDFPWETGTDISWSDWSRFMVKKIRTAWQYKSNRHERFLRENGWAS